MDEILRQLEPLLIGSVPTMIIFIFLVLAYKFLLLEPLTKVLAERRQRTEGAVERAHAAIAAADAKAQEYDAKLRAARAEIFRARENRIKIWATERDNALASARQAARDRVHAERDALSAQAQSSKREIEHSVDELAAQIVTSVLPKRSGEAVPAGGSR